MKNGCSAAAPTRSRKAKLPLPPPISIEEKRSVVERGKIGRRRIGETIRGKTSIFLPVRPQTTSCLCMRASWFARGAFCSGLRLPPDKHCIHSFIGRVELLARVRWFAFLPFHYFWFSLSDGEWGHVNIGELQTCEEFRQETTREITSVVAFTFCTEKKG